MVAEAEQVGDVRGRLAHLHRVRIVVRQRPQRDAVRGEQDHRARACLLVEGVDRGRGACGEERGDPVGAVPGGDRDEVERRRSILGSATRPLEVLARSGVRLVGGEDQPDDLLDAVGRQCGDRVLDGGCGVLRTELDAEPAGFRRLERGGQPRDLRGRPLPQGRGATDRPVPRVEFGQLLGGGRPSTADRRVEGADLLGRRGSAVGHDQHPDR